MSQILFDTIVEQRNGLMNQLAQAQASMKVMTGEIERLNAELAKAKKRKRKGARNAAGNATG